MTATEKSTRRTLGNTLLACVIWTLMVGTAVIEVSILIPVVTPHAINGWDEANLYMSLGCFAVFWLWCLVSEHAYRYNPRRARGMRRLGWLSQTVLLSINALGGWAHLPNLIAAMFFIVMANLLWHGWMRSQRLHPDDQKVIDELIAKQAEEQGRRIAQAEQATREAHMQSAIKHLGLTNTAPAGLEPDHRPVIWKVRRGQHASLVYFLRNGNRIKIGTTTDLYQRIRRLALRQENVALILPGGRAIEAAYHKQFAAFRIGNTEWFEAVSELTDFIHQQATAAANNAKKEA